MSQFNFASIGKKNVLSVQTLGLTNLTFNIPTKLIYGTTQLNNQFVILDNNQDFVFQEGGLYILDVVFNFISNGSDGTSNYDYVLSPILNGELITDAPAGYPNQSRFDGNPSSSQFRHWVQFQRIFDVNDILFFEAFFTGSGTQPALNVSPVNLITVYGLQLPSSYVQIYKD